MIGRITPKDLNIPKDHRAPKLSFTAPDGTSVTCQEVMLLYKRGDGVTEPLETLSDEQKAKLFADLKGEIQKLVEMRSPKNFWIWRIRECVMVDKGKPVEYHYILHYADLGEENTLLCTVKDLQFVINSAKFRKTVNALLNVEQSNN